MRIGLEWMVLDRATYGLHPAAPDIVFRLDRHHAAWAAVPELDATTLDVATSALDGYRAAADTLEDMRCCVRRDARSVGAAVAGGGAHPVRTCGGQREPGRFAGFGMHVQIGAPDADEAVRIGAWLNQRAPLFIALSASSPYWRGVLGDWIDPCTGRKHSIDHVVRNDLARLAARSDDPDFPAACVLIHELLHNGGQAHWLTAHVAAGAAPDDLARLASAIFDSPVASGWKVEQ